MTISELKTKLEKSLEFLKGELNKIRTGRVTPALLDNVKINAYESLLSVREVGTISVVDGQTLQITPWDKSLLENIEKDIRKSDLGLNPSVINDAVMVPVPTLTEERRKEFTRLVSAKVEEAKSSIRNVRHDVMRDIETGFENKDYGEDEKFTKKEEAEEAVKDFVKQAEDLGESKKKEILGN